jgi:hypothetical protein
METPELLHAMHVKAKQADCVNCHKVNQHDNFKLNIANQMDCFQCHKEQKAKFMVQIEVYMGMSLGFPEPNPMAIAGVACSACHRRNEKGCSNGKDSCHLCHVEGYEKLVPLWQMAIQKKLTHLRDRLKQGIMEKWLPSEPKHMIQFLEKLKWDGSQGVHNIKSINSLLERSITALEELAPMDKK